VIVEYSKKSTQEKSAKVPTYGPGDKFPDGMERVQRYPRSETMDHPDEARPRYAESSNMNPIEDNVCEYPRHDGGKKVDPYDPTVPMTREGDTLDKRSRKADE